MQKSISGSVGTLCGALRRCLRPTPASGPRVTNKAAITRALRILDGTPFEVLESLGFHLTRRHFYSPIPDVAELARAPAEWWTRESDLHGIQMNEDAQVRLLEAFTRFAPEYSSFPHEPSGVPHEFHLNNGSFGGTDALVLYCLVRHLAPRGIIEVGGGHSTLLSARAALANGNTQLTCIEPYPNEALRAGLPGLTTLVKRGVQEVPVDFFLELHEGDVLFIDSTHTVKTGSDVNYLFFEVIPRLHEGVYIHFHDVFLPCEYPRSWVVDLHLFWAEMYLLRAFLMFNSAFEVVFANYFMGLRHAKELRLVFPDSPWVGGGSFWVRKRN